MCVPVCMSVRLFFCMHVHTPVCLSVCLSVCLFMCLSVCVCVCMYVGLNLWLPGSLMSPDLCNVVLPLEYLYLTALPPFHNDICYRNGLRTSFHVVLPIRHLYVTALLPISVCCRLRIPSFFLLSVVDFYVNGGKNRVERRRA